MTIFRRPMDELIRNLSQIDGLAPRSRTSSFAFGQTGNIHEVLKSGGLHFWFGLRVPPTANRCYSWFGSTMISHFNLVREVF
jgi:hypothetical protein